MRIVCVAPNCTAVSSVRLNLLHPHDEPKETKSAIVWFSVQSKWK